MRVEYTPYVWPAIVTTACLTVLAVYAWRRRSVPGALPFVALMICGIQWALGSGLELATGSMSGKIFWAEFQSAWHIPAATAGLWFALDYADLRRWLVRRNFVLAAVPPFLWLLLALTNDIHHSLWSGVSLGGPVQLVYSTVAWILLAYAYVLGLGTVLVFVWLFWRSPLHRLPVGLCLCGQVVVRVAYGLRMTGALPEIPVDPVVLTFNFTAATYALALFRFRLFNLIPIVRGTVIDQMREGMLVLDTARRIMDLNPAAESILGVSAARARGTDVTGLLPGCGLEDQSEITLSVGGAIRHYALHKSVLNDRRDHQVGTLILLDDVTGQKQAQAQLLEQQRALATHQERERVARELHDTLGQVLGYLKMQAEIAQTFLDQDTPSEAKRRLARLAAAAQGAQIDVREYILAARTGITAGANFLRTLQTYLQRFSDIYGIAAKLDVSPDLGEGDFEPMVEAQLLRIIQEALSNVRKHAQAAGVDIRIRASGGNAEAVIQDDGVGFDPALLKKDGGQTYGLRVMSERANEVGGAVRVDSAPGAGTRVVVSVPLLRPPAASD